MVFHIIINFDNYLLSIVKVFHFPITLLSVLNCNNQRLLGTRLFPIYMLQLHSGYFFSSYHSFFAISTSTTSKKCSTSCLKVLSLAIINIYLSYGY